MQFKDIKQNYPVYILDKQNVKFTQGKVLSVSFPHMDNSNPMSMGKTVVDVVIEAEGKSATYAIPESMNVAYAGELVISTDRDGIIREVEALKNNSEQYLKGVDKTREVLEKSKSLLAELNPEIKAKQENEQRLSNLENTIKNIQTDMKDFKEMMSDFIKEMKG